MPAERQRRAVARGDAARFDAAFYERFYRDARTCVADSADTLKLARLVHAYLAYLDVPVRSILDAGCGLGFWRDAAAALWPNAQYTGIEISDFLCTTHGWTQASIVDYAPGRRFDLVICQSVLQYLDDRAAARAIANLARLARGAIYVEAPTREDWTRTCDKGRTDGEVHLRPAAWYRRRFARHFVTAGAGVFVPRQGRAVLYALERAES